MNVSIYIHKRHINIRFSFFSLFYTNIYIYIYMHMLWATWPNQCSIIFEHLYEHLHEHTLRTSLSLLWRYAARRRVKRSSGPWTSPCSSRKCSWKEDFGKVLVMAVVKVFVNVLGCVTHSIYIYIYIQYNNYISIFVYSIYNYIFIFIYNCIFIFLFFHT